ncbi:ATP-dependent DNA helicase DinG [Paenibacillus aurantius]|uniref:3'-5' exonuclease DinG n=1 Tax=Paenibacillus aurantius TaxID=2918900 RepID=A0AA96LJ10_9BACL|nr:ATP-dependent DNA helicase DinG [Paenibacillus aurantius]WNQ14269.1 ATP-dependent DNA helicase DinG [Paenibacillus aurantius]
MKFAVLDFETTGGQPADEIIQVGLVIIEDERITERYSSYVKPTVPIPPFITSLTGITEEQVQDAPGIETVIMEMQHLLKGSILVGHNVSFDLGFLQRALETCGYFPFNGMVLDTIDLLRMLFPNLTSLQLSNACQALGIPHERPHQADSDAEVTAELWLRCIQKFEELPLLTVQRLAALFQDETTDLAWFMTEQGKRKEMTVTLDPDHYKYFRQFALNVEDWGEEELERSEEQVKEHLAVEFEPFYERIKSSLATKFEVFEERKAQDQMIQEVTSSFEEDRHLMIEAGTGTGKSLGYLVPALYYGIQNEKKVLVSTHTINLQEQLKQRDLPLLHEIFPVPFRAALLKGRSHYLCLRKFEQKVTYAEYENRREDLITAAQMIVWLTETGSGDEEELHFGPRGGEFWRTVASDTDSCLNRSCPWFKKCYYHRARNEAQTADVVITNHSMLFTDIKAENRLLPAYKHLVIDEAHHFEEVASKHLGLDVQYLSILNTISWLFKDSKMGQLPMLRAKISRSDDLFQETAARWCETIDSFYPKLMEIKEQWEELASLFYDVLAANSDGQAGEAGQLVYRVKDEALPSQWGTLVAMEESLFDSLSSVLRQLDKLLADVKEVQEVVDAQSLVTDLGGTVKELYRHRDALRFFMKRSDPDYVYWMEAGTYYKMKSLQLVSVPVSVSRMLQEHFFEAKDSVIMTSATLSVDKKFDYTADQFGLNGEKAKEKLRTVLLPSPFNYRKQALVCVPRDFPGVKGPGGEGLFLEKLVQSLADVARTTQGRMLVLFTSYRMLKQVHAELRERLLPEGIQVLGQGIDSGNRSKLTKLFQTGGPSVLLGTSSFWEGVDIPGEALTCLAIVRLPFQPPTHPVVEAKCDQIKKNNQNPFMKLSVPQAVIRFKQGFGRLVRTAQDKGIVILYDTRVIDTQYGKYFLYSLPGPKIESMTSAQMAPRIKEWMEGEPV